MCKCWFLFEIISTNTSIYIDYFSIYWLGLLFSEIIGITKKKTFIVLSPD